MLQSLALALVIRPSALRKVAWGYSERHSARFAPLGIHQLVHYSEVPLYNYTCTMYDRAANILPA